MSPCPGRLLLVAIPLVFGGFGVGCAHYTASIDPDDKLDPKSAYLYGRFTIEADNSTLSSTPGGSVAFTFRCENGKTYSIGFSDETPLQVIRIKPSRCEFVEILLGRSDGRLLKRIPVAPGTLRDGVFSPSRGYYLGDFSTTASEKSTQISQYTIRTRWRWGLMQAEDDYQATTKQMRQDFPNLRRLPTEDRMLGQEESVATK
jgi:hypothetical protein